jgi:hypothetical protein
VDAALEEEVRDDVDVDLMAGPDDRDEPLAGELAKERVRACAVGHGLLVGRRASRVLVG